MNPLGLPLLHSRCHGEKIIISSHGMYYKTAKVQKSTEIKHKVLVIVKVHGTSTTIPNPHTNRGPTKSVFISVGGGSHQ